MNLKKIFNILFKLSIVLLGIYSLYIEARGETVHGAMLGYYTIQSNILVILFTMMMLVSNVVNDHFLKSSYYFIIKGGFVIMIFITFLVFHFVLRTQIMRTSPEYLYSHRNLIQHYFVPLSTLFDYFLFDTKGQLKYKYSFIWLSIPISYGLFVYIHSYCFDGKFYNFKGIPHDFPYLFMDWKKNGITKTIINDSTLIVSFQLISLFFIFIDHLIAQQEKSKKN